MIAGYVKIRKRTASAHYDWWAFTCLGDELIGDLIDSGTRPSELEAEQWAKDAVQCHAEEKLIVVYG